MASVYRSILLNQVREMTNTENSTFVTDSELEVRLNASARRLYNLLVQARGQEYFKTSTTLTMSVNETTYNLPTDFYEILSVTVTTPGNQNYRITPFEENELVDIVRGNDKRPEALRYRLMGRQRHELLSLVDQIEFYPIPASVFQVTVRYIPYLTCEEYERTYDPGGGGDLITVTNEVEYTAVGGWEEVILLDTAEYIAQKEEGDVSWYVTRRREIEDTIRSLASARDVGAAPHVSDVRGKWGSRRSRWQPLRRPATRTLTLFWRISGGRSRNWAARPSTPPAG